MEIEIGEALERSDLLFIDVRSPDEYQEASIPGAVNIPLFDNQEHCQVGIIFHQLGETEARRAALEFVAPKLTSLVDKIVKTSGTKTPLLYCRQGGMRSLSLYEILKLTGITALRLKKGYKAYRSYINKKLASYELNSKLFVLHGLTGVGKTAVLKILEERGCPIIDLEGLANHRGSVFGTIGLYGKRSQKDFDALLLQELDRFSGKEFLFIEGEGRRIGDIYLPPFLAKAMDCGYQILLTAPLETRVDRIIETYIPTVINDHLRQELKAALESLRKRLGNKKTEQLHLMLNVGDYRNIARIMCTDYYDLFYNDSQHDYSQFDGIVDAENPEFAADKIVALTERIIPAGNHDRVATYQNI